MANEMATQTTAPITVHMIGNAHLDPAWLWHWQRGSDEAVATCRAACDILDDYPQAIFTRGEGWVYQQLLETDPRTLARVKAHVAAGRWEVVNGWWVQPDVLNPTEEAILKSAELGHAFVREHLGVRKVHVGYNVDSFGHGAFLPRMLRRIGQEYYVFMRPMWQENPLPLNLFRWQSPDGHEVLTFRIPNGYGCWKAEHLEGHIRGAVAETPADIGHVMCFYGVGNHGGGLTRSMVKWIAEHQDFAPGVRLEFSSPLRFFKAVRAKRDQCPVVIGELLHHAPGCYSVCGGLKRDLRRAELAAIDAERLLKTVKGRNDVSADRAALERAWERICFNQFHDLLPGSSVSEVIETARQEVGAAICDIDRVVHRSLRRYGRFAEKCPLDGQRIQIVNRCDAPWLGHFEFEVWNDWQPWKHHLVDADGRLVPSQVLQPASLLVEAGMNPVPRLLFGLDMQPMEHVALRMAEGEAPAAELPGSLSYVGGVLANAHLRIKFCRRGISSIADASGKALIEQPIDWLAIQDTSDTWSHGIESYCERVENVAEFGEPYAVETGPLRATVRLEGRIGGSDVRLYASLYRDEPVVHVRIETNYRERRTVLKARVTPAGGVSERRDRMIGGFVSRGLDGREYPVMHGMVLGTGAGPLALVTPDTFAADCDAAWVRPTIIRNSLNAFHSTSRLEPNWLPRFRERFGTDEGPQSLRMALAFGPAATEENVEMMRRVYQQPPHAWDDFRGARLAKFE